MMIKNRLLPLLILFTAWMPSVGHTDTADHSRYGILQQNFSSGPQVTRACLSCHVLAAGQVMETIHWTWVCPKAVEQGDKIGKVYVINNFCIAIQSNEPRCTSCHAGYGWKDKHFDFEDETRVDCLICHDSTGTYKKFPTGAGHPAYEEKVFAGEIWEPPDLSRVAQNVARPTRDNCGDCHFYGGGGEGVKHADLDVSLYEPDRALDVHMDAEGNNFLCQDCHTTREHRIAGRCYSIPATDSSTFRFPRDIDDSHIYCQSCHGNTPHAYGRLNAHLDRVSCQACHIPRAARRKATKTSWDWSQAGRLDNGKAYKIKDAGGNVIYDSKKGSFTWKKNFIPDYVWFDGTADTITLTDPIDDTKTVRINSLGGSADDPRSRIWPVKIHRGRQPYDPVNKRLVIPKLYGPGDSGAFWSDYDWTASVRAGMDYVDMPFSGRVGFVETEMYWPVTHMVAPADQAAGCAECHTRKNGRLASLNGLYIPGRDRFPWLDRAGWLLALLTLAGVFAHGGLRLTYRHLKRLLLKKRWRR